MKKIGRIFWLLVYFFSPLVLFYFVMTTKSPFLQRKPDYVASTFFGTFAYSWFCYQFIISARPKFIEKHFGMDNLYRFHGIMAGVALLSGLTHFLIRRNYFIPDPPFGLYALILFALISMMAVVFLLNTKLRKVKPVETVRQFVDGKIGFKRYYSVLAHNFSLVAATILFLHVITASANEFSPTAKYLHAAIFIIGVLFWLYHQIVRRIELKQTSFSVLENHAENSTTRSLHLKPNTKQIFRYKPGQFAFLSVHNGRITSEPHPYTIASSPSNKNEIEFVIKNSGDYTSQLNLIEPGDEVHVDAPFGIFSYLNYPKEDSLVFVAGGIGITPFLSMLRWMKENDSQRKVILLWGCRFKEDLIKSEEFTSFEAAMPNFQWYPVLSDEPDFTGETGFFNAEKLNRLAVSEIEIKRTGFYTCGPPIMMKIVDAALQELGVPKAHIHYEKFSF
jgi:predicted ferric reductase